jgi:hypothetical protein
MDGTIISSNDLAVLRPLWGKGPGMKLWAESGLVFWSRYDKVAGYEKCGSMTWQKAATHVLGLSEMVAKPADGGYASERQQIQRFISEMEVVIRKAKEQGGPDDLEEAAEEHRRRRPKSFIIPKVVDLLV